MYLNLDRRTDRRQTVESVLARTQLPVVRIPAVDGQDLDLGWKSAMLPGEVACAIGHAQIWRKVLESGQTWLVAEDDLIGCQDWVDRFQSPLHLPEHWTMLMLGVSWPGPAAAVPGSDVSRVHSFCGCFSYVLTPAAAETLLQLRRLIPGHVSDWYTQRYNQESGSTYVVTPTWFIAGQDSDIAVRSTSPDRWGRVWADHRGT